MQCEMASGQVVPQPAGEATTVLAKRNRMLLVRYDSRKLREGQGRELLWMTRFSIRAKGRRFDRELAEMSSAASSLFGKEGGKLRRRLQSGSVKFGEIEVLGVLDEAETESK